MKPLKSLSWWEMYVKAFIAGKKLTCDGNSDPTSTKGATPYSHEPKSATSNECQPIGASSVQSVHNLSSVSPFPGHPLAATTSPRVLPRTPCNSQKSKRNAGHDNTIQVEKQP